MTISISTTGNGKFVTGDQSAVVIDYSLNESATGLDISELKGEVPGLSVTALNNTTNTSGLTHPSSKLLIGNTLAFSDSLRGSFEGKITSANLNKETVSVVALSVFDKLNSTKSALSKNDTIDNIIKYYLELAGLTSGQYDVDFSTDTVTTPPWKRNVFQAIKLLCATFGAEMYFKSDKVYVRPVAQKEIKLTNTSISSFNVEVPQSIENTRYLQRLTTSANDAIAYVVPKSTSPLAVDFNETNEQILRVSMAVSSVNQPEYIAQVPSKDFFPEYNDYIQESSINTTPSVYTNGFYAFYDINNNIVAADKLSGAGVKAETTDNVYEIKLTITGPNTSATTPWKLAFSSVDPALAITADGVTIKTTEINSPTGIVDDEIDDSAATEFMDNPFMITTGYTYDTIYRTNQRLAGPIISINLSTDIIEEANNQEFGYLPGAIFEYEGSKYRVVKSDYSYGNITITAEQYVTFADFNTKWAGKTYDDFSSTMFTPATAPTEYMTHSDFAIISLMEPV